MLVASLLQQRAEARPVFVVEGFPSTVAARVVACTGGGMTGANEASTTFPDPSISTTALNAAAPTRLLISTSWLPDL